MSATEVVKVDPIVSGPDGQSILERPLGKAAAVAVLEYIGLLGAASDRTHFPHQRRRVFVGNDFHRGREVHIAADVIEVSMRIDESGHRLVGNLSELL